MNQYHSSEKQFFDWLMAKHDADNRFTFSVRKIASKDAENDYFIGKESSKYFGTTFWSIKTGYPGSSTDLIDFVIKPNDNGYCYYIHFIQTRSPEDKQNELALALILSIKERLRVYRGFYENDPLNKIEYFHVGDAKKVYKSMDELLKEAEEDIQTVIPIVDEEIARFKKKNPDLIAHRITNEEFDTMIERMEKRRLKNPQIDSIDEMINEEKVEEETKADISHPLNVIFYGPPGTGKTYNTLIRAAEIILGRKVSDYDEAISVFNEYRGDQIEFITFHQNYSYEDFIQGLRPNTDDEEKLSFEKKDGIFKIISDRALKNLKAATTISKTKMDFEDAFEQFARSMIEGEKGSIEVRMKTSHYAITDITEKTIKFEKASGSSTHSLSISTLKRMYEAGNTLNIKGLNPYYDPLLGELLKIGSSKKSNPSKVERKNFVIIIDEINRANTSRVFGELITLIEEEKRSNGSIPLSSTLPSGDSFVVPSNLYIIGTMNTADKSIALLDIALRRRFDFEPMYPLYDIPGHEIFDVDVLKKLNERIISSKGYDFQIGHSYFMGKEHDLTNRMNKKVIPLLLEYFMNDEKEVREILKYAGLEIVEPSWPLQITGKKS